MAARPLVTVYNEKNEATQSQIKLPAVFRAPIRPDIVNFIHDQVRKNKRQPYAVAKEAIGHLLMSNGEQLVGINLVFIIEELRKKAEAEKDRLARELFEQFIRGKQIRFLMLRDEPGYRLPSKLRIRQGARRLNREDGSQLQMSLFDPVVEDGFNETEKTVAWYLDEQKKRVAAEESKDEVNAYAIRLENRLIAQQKELESLQGRKRDMLTELYCARVFLLGGKSTCATEVLPRRIDRAIKIGEM